jgi:hypothetical protein
MGGRLTNLEILQTLRLLSGALSQPVWLFGGVAVDFLVGRWTRPHGDIDLNAYSDSRDQLTEELNAVGFRTTDEGWLTHWALGGKQWRLEVVFLERSENDSGVLVIRPGDPIGIPGRYPMPPGYLDPNRYATLEGIMFRVCSPAGEWLARAGGTQVVAGRPPDPKIEHDRLLLEGLLTTEELEILREEGYDLFTQVADLVGLLDSLQIPAAHEFIPLLTYGPTYESWRWRETH